MKKSVFFHVFLFSSILLLVGERHVQAAVTATQTNSVMNSFRKTPGETSDPVTQFVKQRYPGVRILDRDWDDGLIEVKIRHKGVEKIAVFSPDRKWMRTVWEVRRESLPSRVVSAMKKHGFNYRHIDDNDNKAIESQRGLFFAIQVDDGRHDGVYILSSKGNPIRRYHNDEWDDGDDCIRILGEDWDDSEDRFDEGDDEWDERWRRWEADEAKTTSTRVTTSGRGDLQPGCSDFALLLPHQIESDYVKQTM